MKKNVDRHFSRGYGIVAALAVVGLIAGIAAGMWFTNGPGRFRAETKLAMLPGPQVGAPGLSSFWEVLNSGQPTRTGAQVLGQSMWLQPAAAAAGVPGSQLALSAAAVPATSLIQVSVDADSPSAAEAALAGVLEVGMTRAGEASGPYVLQILSPVAGSAKPLSASRTQTVGTFGVGGLLLGGGLGMLLAAWSRRRAGQSAADRGDAPVAGNESTLDNGSAPSDPPTRPLPDAPSPLDSELRGLSLSRRRSNGNSS